MPSDSSKTKAQLLEEIARLKKEAESNHFRQLFEATPLPYQSLDHEGKILDVNQAWLDFLGYKKEAVLGRFFGEFMTSDSMNQVSDHFRDFLAGGGACQADVTLIKRDGERVLVSINGRSGVAEKGEIGQTHCILHDVTEQRRAESSLATSEQQFRGLFESSIDGIVYTDILGSIVSANPSFCAMLGSTPDDILGKNILDITPRKWHAMEADISRDQVLPSGYADEFEKELRHKDGHPVPVAVRIWLSRDDEGNTLGSWGVARDLTTQKIAETKAAKSEERYRLLAENSEDVIWAVDNNLNYTYVSPSVIRLRGFTPEEVIAGTFEEAMTPESWLGVQKAFQAVLEAEAHGEMDTVSRMDVEVRCKDGSTVWVESVARAILDEEGNRTGFVGSNRGIADRRRAEQQLQEGENSLRALLDATSDSVGLFALDGTMLTVNQNMAEALGGTVEELVGQNILQHVSPDVGASRTLKFQEAIDSKAPVRLRDVRGGRILDSVYYPIFGESGEVSTMAVYAKDVTDTIFAEEARKQSEEQYRRIVETANEGIMGLDASEHITYANQIMADFLGYELGELVGAVFSDFLSPEESEDHEKRMSHRKKGQRERYERCFVRKDGSAAWGLVSATPMLADDGRHLGSFAMIADITETKEASGLIRESEERYRLIVETANECIVGLDADAVISYANQVMVDFLGYELHEIVGHPVQDFYLPEDLGDHEKRMSRRRDGQPERYERRYVRKDGKVVWGLVSATPLQDDDGRYLGAFAMVADITEAKAADALIRDNEERYRRIVETANEGVLNMGPDGTIAFVNKRMADMLGYPVYELLGKSMANFMFPDDQEALKEQLESRKRGLSDQFERRYRHKDGHEVWTLVSASPIFGDDGLYKGALGMITNISARKQAEEELLSSERKYRNIFENSVEGIYQSTPDGRFVSVNPAMARLMGYDSPEELMESVSDISSQFYSFPEERDSLIGILNEYGEILNCETRLTRKDGSPLWISENARVVRDENGTPVMYEGSVIDITERKRAEEALKLTQFSVDNASIDIYWINSEGRFVYANERACEALWYTREELLELTIPDINPRFQPEDWADYWDERRSQDIKRFETVHQRKDGSEFPVGITSHYRRYGGEEYLFTYAYDLTEREQAEEKLRRSQDLLNEVQRISLTGGWEVDMVTGETHWTDGQFQLHGLEPGDTPADIKRFFEYYVHPEDRAKLAEGWHTVTREKIPVEQEYRSIKADGTEAVFVGVAIPDVDESGELRRVFGSTRDVTIERQTQEELKQAHERLLTILDGIDAHIYVSDLETNDILFMNAHMREAFGSPVENATCHEVFRNDPEPCSFCPKPDLFDAVGNPVETLIQERYNPLTQRWYLNHDRAIEWLKGKLVHMHMAADITELKNMAGELELAMAEAEAANIAKNEFLANMSHEIRTPLNGLLGMLQILLLSKLDDDQRDSLDTAVSSGRNLLQILNDILDLSKIESGKLELEEYDFEVGDVLESVVAVFRHQGKSRGLDITWEIDDSLPRHFLGDKGRLRQILFNLVGNASKFTESGTVAVEAYPLKTKLKSGQTMLYFSVSDTGIGIPDDKVNQIFDPFTQVDGSFTRKYQGTGLGLGIVRRLVALMGGAISITSQIGVGTTIVFTIVVTPLLQTKKPDVIVQARPDGKGVSILVAEDERVNRTVIERLLIKLGHEPLCVDSGEKALEILQSQTFDLVLMDIQMPGIDGLETTRTIRSKLKLDVPVVALTAHAMKGDRDRFLKAGMNGYIAKPFDLAELQEEIERVISLSVK